MAVEPVVYGASERPPRGDYARAGADYTCAQNYAAYTEADHDTYRRLYERQSRLLPGLASQAFIDALPSLGERDRIPRFDEVNERLYRATRWELVAVPGLIPEVPFEISPLFRWLEHRLDQRGHTRQRTREPWRGLAGWRVGLFGRQPLPDGSYDHHDALVAS